MPGSAKIVGRLHDGVPQRPRLHGGIDPHAIGALVGALRHGHSARTRTVHQLPGLALLDSLDEGIRHPHRHIEIVPAPGCALWP